MGPSQKSQLISATVITLNEERSIRRCLESLHFADEIVVVDSGSTDQTVEIAKKLGAKVVIEPWRGYGGQKNLAMQKTSLPWILNIDADEVVSPELANEILKIAGNATDFLPDTHSPPTAYAIARKVFYLNKWIQFGGWYPNYVVRLIRRGCGQWTEPFLHEQLLSTGPVARLKGVLLHYTFENIEDQNRTNLKYARQGAQALQAQQVRWPLLKMLFKPLWKFIDCYFLKLGFMDGFAGFVIAINSAHSMFLKYAFFIEAQIAK